MSSLFLADDLLLFDELISVDPRRCVSGNIFVEITVVVDQIIAFMKCLKNLGVFHSKLIAHLAFQLFV